MQNMLCTRRHGRQSYRDLEKEGEKEANIYGMDITC